MTARAEATLRVQPRIRSGAIDKAVPVPQSKKNPTVVGTAAAPSGSHFRHGIRWPTPSPMVRQVHHIRASTRHQFARATSSSAQTSPTTTLWRILINNTP